MLSRFRSQLRLLTLSAVAVAAFAMPGAAHAAASLELTADGVGGEADSEYVFSYPGDSTSYALEIYNSDAVTDTASTTFEVEYDASQLSIDDTDITTSAGPVTACESVVNADLTTTTCTIPDVVATDAYVITVDAELVEAFNGPLTSISFTARAAGPLSDTVTDTTPYSTQPICTVDDYQASKGRAALQSSPTIVVALECSDPDGGGYTFDPIVGENGTLTQTGANEATYTASASALANPSGFYDFFMVNVEDAEGDTARLYIQVRSTRSSDLKVAVTGATTFAVPASGGNVTYTMTITNAGPEAIGTTGAGWTISDKATIVSATFGGATATCQNAEFGSEGERSFGCGSGALPAVGGSTTATITVRYAAGEKGLTVPSSVKVTGSAFPSGGAQDDAPADDNRQTITTALTVPSPVIVTPTTGTAGSDSYVGTSGNDRYDGGAGNDALRGGAGNDVLIGGLGNDRLFGGIGADILNGGLGSDVMYGESGNDKLLAGAGNDYADGGAGNDIVVGEAGNDKVFGGIGNDRINGGIGNDVVYGQAGVDLVYCGSGKDLADGGAGNDGINCADGTGGDTIRGGIGRDFCRGDRGDVFVSCERKIINK